MGDNMPELDERGPEKDPLDAPTEQQAIYVSEYNGQAMALGDETKEEWILAEACYGLDWMR